MLQDLINNGCSESEIQKYLQEHPYILNSVIHPDMRIYPKFKLGSEYECDFINYFELSTHSETTIIELKLPSAKLLTKSNIPTKDLNLALSQVSKYMSWIRDNEIYFRKRLLNISTVKSIFYKNIMRYGNLIKSIIIIGRRDQYNENEDLFRQDVFKTTYGSIEIVSYDRLIEYENNRIK